MTSMLSLGPLLPRLPFYNHHIANVLPRQGSNASDVQWTTCGAGVQCTNISVPLDYHNASDERTAIIAVNRIPATDQKNRKGSIFFNPGGPGGSGVSLIEYTGAMFSTFLNGQYDLIGFEPRGVNLTNMRITCFDSRLEESIYLANTPPIVNLPASALTLNSSKVKDDLERQVVTLNASAHSLTKECLRKTGEELAYIGTEAVVLDIDFISRKINGDKEPVGYWGFSYGSAIAQYLVKILPPERIGHVFFDAVLNADKWNGYPIDGLDQGVADIGTLIETFASTCIEAGPSCALNAVGSFNSSKQLLAKIDATIDELYYHPAPTYGRGMPGIVTAKELRTQLGPNMYTPHKWSGLATRLAQVLAGNFSELISSVNAVSLLAMANQPDLNRFASQAIRCADTKAYDADRPPPTPPEFAQALLQTLNKYSRRSGESWIPYLYCEAWDAAGMAPRKTYYNGTFEVANGTLSIPALITSNTYDVATPLKNAELAAKHLGNNGRLVQLRGGLGHTMFSHFSLCIGRIVRAYFLNDTIPQDGLTLCDVDEKPWQLANLAEVRGSEGDVAWARLNEAVRQYLGYYML